MSRTPFYLKALDSMLEPATMEEVRQKALSMFGSALKPRKQSVRSSLERYVIIGKATKIVSGGHIAKYWITGKPFDKKEALLREIAKKEEEIAEMRAILNAMNKAVDSATGLSCNALDP